MVFLLLAPYNDSMHLGQGFNSFLQVQCIDKAVEIPGSALKTEAPRSGAGNVSQVVSYSSRFVNKISDVVRSMNISAGSSIKRGTIEVSGNSLSVDEAKFAASDLNAVVSVKVINQTTQLVDDAKFLPVEGVKLDSKKFYDIYGDCFISGFMEGGDLHGIISMEVLDASKKSDVEATLKGQINGSAGEFSLSEGTSSSNLNAALSQTETTITVNWSGGGQVKSETEEWSLESLFRVAASFPSHVASCPQRTWAILTKYDNNRDFIKWADENSIAVPHFTNVQQYTSDLLDTYMEYKNNLARIQAVLADPTAFTLSTARDPVNISVESLIRERKAIKCEMRKVVDEIDALNEDPSKLSEVEGKSTIRSPEVWATRLPIRKDAAADSAGFGHNKAVEVMGGFSFVNDPISDGSHGAAPTESSKISTQAPAPDATLKTTTDQIQQSVATTASELAKASPLQEPPPGSLCSPEVNETLNASEKEFMESEDNRRLYANYRFDRATGHDGGGPFNDAIVLQQSMVPVTWARRIEFRMVSWGSDIIVRMVQVSYDQMQLTHGSEGNVADTLAIDLADGEKINRIKFGKGNPMWGVEGVAFIEIFSTHGQNKRIGNDSGKQVTDYSPPTGFEGLKGFFGGCGDVCDKLAPIWGR